MGWLITFIGAIMVVLVTPIEMRDVAKKDPVWAKTANSINLLLCGVIAFAVAKLAMDRAGYAFGALPDFSGIWIHALYFMGLIWMVCGSVLLLIAMVEKATTKPAEAKTVALPKVKSAEDMDYNKLPTWKRVQMEQNDAQEEN